jgi:hypothetical protein
MKPTPTFHFTDEPQFMTIMSRAETAHRLRSYRNRENGNARRFQITRAPFGYLVRLRAYDEPTAYIITK